MFDEFLEIKRLLDGWNKSEITGELNNINFSDNSCERLRSALYSLKTKEQAPGPADICMMIKHVLLRSNALLNEESSTICVPSNEDFPSREMWKLFGFNIEWAGEGHFSLRINKCIPDLKDAFSEKERRRKSPVEADVCVKVATGHQNYTCVGQRQAIRSIFNSPNGKTFLISLPTGMGKSLVYQLPALLGQGLVLVIVPTIALAKDQEKKIREFTNNDNEDYYWSAELSVERKQLIKEKILAGTQNILFTSPESLAGSLRYTICQAASKSLLKYFVIDEVHLVFEWGLEFRPDFQTLSGLRSLLFEMSPPEEKFRTILMTATLTEETLRVIGTLFVPIEEMTMISSVHLRPEPSYFISKAKDEAEKTSKIFSIIKDAPLPILLYVTEREDAEYWCGILREKGFKRVRYFHGKSSGTARQKIIDDWSESKLDIIVATSAFGVGMDKRDVRTVIHACVPESVDRYYQEVGRGGRDGKACLSFLVYSDKDIKTAKGLNKKKIISVELGFSRWNGMYSTRRKLPENKYLLNLNAVPAHLDQDREGIISWNIRTLVLMARAGLIKMTTVQPPVIIKTENESEEEFSIRREKGLSEYFTSFAVEFTELNPNDLSTWERVIEKERETNYRETLLGYNRMLDILGCRKEFSEIFKQAYDINKYNINVSRVCGGCPECRRKGAEFNSHYRIRTTYRGMESLRITSKTPTVVIYDTPNDNAAKLLMWRSDILRSAEVIIQKYGIREIAISRGVFSDEELNALCRYSGNRFIITSDLSTIDDYDSLFVSRLSIVEPKFPAQKIPEHLFRISRPQHIILVQNNSLNPVERRGLYVETERYVHLRKFIPEI